MGVELPDELVPGADPLDPPVGDPVTIPLPEELPPDGDPDEPPAGDPVEGEVVPPV